MTGHTIIALIAALVTAGGVAHYCIVRRRHHNDYREHLEPILQEHGLRFLSSVYPGPFKIGPFPKFEVRVGRPQSTVPILGKGEYGEYRAVTAADAGGNQYTLWALVEFEVFRFRRVRWRVEEGAPLPETMTTTLET